MSSKTFDGTVLASLRDPKQVVHSLLIDLGNGQRARLPIEELLPAAKGAKPRSFERGTALTVHVIHQNKQNGRLVVSERAAAFLATLDRLEKKGWREMLPEEHSWHYRKGRWEAIAVWPLWQISFRRR